MKAGANVLAQNLRVLREWKELSLDKLSRDLNISDTKWIGWEKEAAEPSLAELIEISNYFRFPVDRLLKKDLSHLLNLNLKRIRFLVVDVDGVMTDGGMYFSHNGDELKKFNVKDGMAIRGLKQRGFEVGIISAGLSENIVSKRAEVLEISRVYVGKEKKLAVLQQWAQEHGFSASEVAYIGDDINDLEVMQWVAISACPADAVKAIQNTAHIVLSTKGGHGCIREFIDEYLLL